MAAKKKQKKFNGFLAVLLALFCVILGTGIGFYGYLSYTAPFETDIYEPSNENKNGDAAALDPSVYADSELQIHFLELGNKYTGDCTYIKAGDTDILIDAGSKVGSISTISAYLDQYVTDGKLEYVIVTHAHEDHYAGFATNENVDSLFDLYECEVIIDFAQTNQKPTGKLYSNYQRELADEIAAGATHYTAKECVDSGNTVFELSENITLTILDQKYYHEADSSGENNHSVCCLITSGDDNFLFTGDLEKKGEASLVELNDLPEVIVYKAGHHGSKTSSHNVLLDVIKPQIVCVCCCAGSPEYTSTAENQFPTQEFIDRVSVYTDAVYVTTLCIDYENNEFTSMNGNIVIYYSEGAVGVACSASDLKLKDTEWFEENRSRPSNW